MISKPLGIRMRFSVHVVFEVLLICAVLAGFQGCERAEREAHAQVQEPPPPPSLHFVAAWGMKGTGPGDLDKPTSIATDVFGNVYIPDEGIDRFIHKFDPAGTPLLTFQDTALTHPQSIATDRGGAIYISDPLRASVFVYLPSGDRYREIRVGTRANAENLLSIAIGDDGEIYVHDAAEGKVFDFTNRFRFVRSWRVPGSDPSEKSNTGAVAIGPDGNLYIADPDSDRVVICSTDGHLVAQINGKSPGPKLSDQLAVSNKYVFVMDADGRTLDVWSIDGKPVLDADLSPQLGQMNRFAPALAAGRSGDLFVLDDRASRVLRYQMKP